MIVSGSFNSGKQNFLILHNKQTSINNETIINNKLINRLPYSVLTSISDIIYKLGVLARCAAVPMMVGMAVTKNMPLAIACGCAAFAFGTIGMGMIKYHRYVDNPLQKFIDARTLRISHEEKNKPTALIIETSYDPTGAFSIPNTRLCRHENIIKNYKVHQIKVSEVNGFRKAIEEVGKVEKISLLWIKGHGSPTSIALGLAEDNRHEVTYLTPEVLKLCEGVLKASLDKDAITVLESCSTGAPLKEGDNVASVFSQCAHGQVYAAKSDSAFLTFSSLNIPLHQDKSKRNVTVVYENGKLLKEKELGQEEEGKKADQV